MAALSTGAEQILAYCSKPNWWLQIQTNKNEVFKNVTCHQVQEQNTYMVIQLRSTHWHTVKKHIEVKGYTGTKWVIEYIRVQLVTEYRSVYYKNVLRGPWRKKAFTTGAHGRLNSRYRYLAQTKYTGWDDEPLRWPPLPAGGSRCLGTPVHGPWQ